MRKILLALSLLMAVSSYALTVDEMLARFNKVKRKSKQRHGAVMEIYVNVHSELAPSRSGSYEATDFGRTLTLEVHADGTVAGRGAEEGRTFELRGGRVDGSHLTRRNGSPMARRSRWKGSSSTGEESKEERPG